MLRCVVPPWYVPACGALLLSSRRVFTVVLEKSLKPYSKSDAWLCPKCASSVSDHCGQYQQDNKQSKVIKQNRGCNRGAPYCWCRVDVPIEKKSKKRSKSRCLPILPGVQRMLGQVRSQPQNPQVQALPAFRLIRLASKPVL